MKKNKKVEIKKTPVGVSTKAYNPRSPKSRTNAANNGYYAEPKSRISKKTLRLILIITAAILLAAIVAGIVSYVIYYYKNVRPVDYLHDDLSRYVSFDKDDYYGYTIEIEMAPITDSHVMSEVIKLIEPHKGDYLYDGTFQRSYPISAADEAWIWYRGYMYDDDGNKYSPSGTSNFFGDGSDELIIGSGKFVTGFEADLLGKVPEDHSEFYKITEGDVLPTDVVYLTASYVKESGSYYEDKQIRIDLSDENVGAEWGVGVYDALFSELKIGDSYAQKKALTLDLSSGEKINYIDYKIEFVTRCEKNPIVVTSYFPLDYRTEELQGKTVYFEVYVEHVYHRETPEFNDEFILETLKTDKAMLDKYEGDSYADKYKARIREVLEAQREDNINTLAEDAFFNHLKRCAEFISIPQGESERVFQNYFYSYNSQYILGGYNQYYSCVEEFIASNYGIQTQADWDKQLRIDCQNEIKEKLIFYKLLRDEGLAYSDEEYEVRLNEYIEQCFEALYEKTRADYASEEKYLADVNTYKNRELTDYGDTYFMDSMYTDYAMSKLISLANIVVK